MPCRSRGLRPTRSSIQQPIPTESTLPSTPFFSSLTYHPRSPSFLQIHYNSILKDTSPFLAQIPSLPPSPYFFHQPKSLLHHKLYTLSTPQLSPFLPSFPPSSALSTIVILGTTSPNAALSFSLGSNPNFFSAVSERYSPAVPQARKATPTARRVRGVRLRKVLWSFVSLLEFLGREMEEEYGAF